MCVSKNVVRTHTAMYFGTLSRSKCSGSSHDLRPQIKNSDVFDTPNVNDNENSRSNNGKTSEKRNVT